MACFCLTWVETDFSACSEGGRRRKGDRDWMAVCGLQRLKYLLSGFFFFFEKEKLASTDQEHKQSSKEEN